MTSITYISFLRFCVYNLGHRIDTPTGSDGCKVLEPKSHNHDDLRSPKCYCLGRDKDMPLMTIFISNKIKAFV